MKIELKKFGDILTSRPSGREAYLAMSAYLTRDLKKDEEIIIDFDGVKVLTPSWADEVITRLQEKYKKVEFINAKKNSSVKATLEILDKINKGIEGPYIYWEKE